MRPSANPTHHTERVLAVVAATIISLSCGTNYAFSAWGPQFATKLGLTATQSNLIGNFGNIGMYAMGIPGGFLIDTKGPRWGVAVGTIALACGYFPLKKAYDEGAGYMGMPALCFFGMLTGLGSCTAFSASIKVCATNWPAHRGTATAFPLAAFGLSAFFYTGIAAAVFPDDTSGYLFLLAVGTSVMTFVGMLFLRMIPPGHHDKGNYRAVTASKRSDDSNRMHRTSSASRASPLTKHGHLGTNELGTPEETSSLVSSSSSSISGPGDINHDAKRPDITGWALMRSAKFWQLFVMLALLCGVGLMSINNIGNNATALWHHYDDSASRDFIQQRQLMHVSILSFCSFLGRLASGIGSDWLLHRHASRFWTLVASSILFVLAQSVALTLTNPHNLFLLSGLTGLAYGVLFGVYPALVADAFGSSGMGINWGAMTWAPVISGNIFNLCYGTILDRHSVFKGTPGTDAGERVCDDGRDCYASAYWVTLAASLVGVVWSLACIWQERVEAQGERRSSVDRGGREHDV